MMKQKKMSKRVLDVGVSSGASRSIRKKRSTYKTKQKCLALMLVGTLIASNLSGSVGASYSGREVSEVMADWVSMSESQRDEAWANMPEEEQNLILSQVNADGVIDASVYAITDPHSEDHPIWCICEEDTGVRSIVVNDDTYEKTFEKVLAPTGDPVTAMSNGSDGLSIEPVGNGITPTWNRTEGHLIYFGEYGGKKIANRVLETSHTAGYQLRGDNTQSLNGIPSIMLEADKGLYAEPRVMGVTANDLNYAYWNNSDIFYNLNGSSFYNNAYTEIEKKLINTTQTNALSKYGAPEDSTVQKEFGETYFDVLTESKVWILSMRETLGYYYEDTDRDRESVDTVAGSSENIGIHLLRSEATRASISRRYSAGYINSTRNYNIYTGSPGQIFTNHALTENTWAVSPAINLNLSAVSSTSLGTFRKELFSTTKYASYVGSGEQEKATRTWDVTIKASESFNASNTNTVLTEGDTITIPITNNGNSTADKFDGFESIDYDRISAVLMDSDGMVVMYGKVGDINDTEVTIQIPNNTEIALGNPLSHETLKADTYELKLFAEEVNSVDASGNMTHKTDYASNMVTVATVLIDTIGFDIQLDDGTNMSLKYLLDDAEANLPTEMEAQSDIGTYIYEANQGYYFPSSYEAYGTCNGITVEPYGSTQTMIKVSGKITDHTQVILPAPSAINYELKFEKYESADNQELIHTYTYNINTKPGTIVVPAGPEVTGKNFKYWVKAGTDEDIRIYAGDFYNLVYKSETYRPVYGDVESFVHIPVKLDSVNTDYNFTQHQAIITLHNSVGEEMYRTEGIERIVKDGTYIYRAVIGDVRNGTYKIYVEGRDSGFEVTVDATSDKDITESDNVFFYTVTFESTVGLVTEEAVAITLNGTPATIPSDITGEGFLGWAYDGTTDIVYPELINITDKTKFVAIYESPRYWVRFEDENGDVWRDIYDEFQYGDIIDVPDGPEVDGKTFSHWKEKDRTVDDVVIPGYIILDPVNNPGVQYTVLHKDITFIPVYGENKTNLILDLYLDDVEWVDPNRVFKLYQDGQLVAICDKDEVFVGIPDGIYDLYMTDSQMNDRPIGQTVEVRTSGNSANEQIVTLEFYTVTHHFNSQQVPATIVQEVLKFSDAVEPTTIPSKVGYDFIEWSSDGKVIDTTTDIQALYGAKEYLVTFLDYDKSVISSEYYDCDSAVKTPNPTAQLGQELNYWVKVNEDGSYDESVRIISGFSYGVLPYDITFAPVYKDTTATVKLSVYLDHTPWNDHDKTFVLQNVSTKVQYTMSSVADTFVNIPLATYTVVEKTTAGDFDTQVLVTVAGVDVITTTLPIYYYNVRYLDEENGASLGYDQIIYHGEDATVPNVTPSKDGATFTGWSRTNIYIDSKYDIYPIYDGASHLITFRDADGSVLQSGFQVEGALMVVPLDPEHTGYTFIGWEPSVPAYVPGEATVYTAVYDKDFTYEPDPDDPNVQKVLITFYDVDGKVLQSGYQAVGATLVQPNTPTRDGYIFDGWTPNVASSVPSVATVYYATYIEDPDWVEPEVPTVDKSLISFVDWDNAVIQSSYQVVGTTLVKPSNPVRAGYTFTGWTPDVASIVPGEAVTYKATYTLDETYIPDPDIPEVEDPEPTPDPESTPDPDPLPESNDYYITFKDWDGTVLKSGYQTEGATMSKPSNPSRSGYIFLGWSPSVPSVVPGYSQTYTALYEKESSNDTSGGSTGGSTGGGTTTKPPSVVYPSTDKEDENIEDTDHELELEAEILPGETVDKPSTGGDANANGIPDHLEDLDGDGVIDSYVDANNNGIPDYLEDLNGNGIPDGEEDINGNGIPDYLEDWWMADGQASTGNCNGHFPHFLIMMILLGMEFLWLKDRKERQDRRYNKLVRDLDAEQKVMKS